MGLAVSGGRGANGSRRCLYQGQAPTRRQNKSSEIIFQDPCVGGVIILSVLAAAPAFMTKVGGLHV